MFTGVVGTIAYAWRGVVPWGMFARLAVGVVPAAFLGARLFRRTRSRGWRGSGDAHRRAGIAADRGDGLPGSGWCSWWSGACGWERAGTGWGGAVHAQRGGNEAEAASETAETASDLRTTSPTPAPADTTPTPSAAGTAIHGASACEVLGHEFRELDRHRGVGRATRQVGQQTEPTRALQGRSGVGCGSEPCRGLGAACGPDPSPDGRRALSGHLKPDGDDLPAA